MTSYQSRLKQNRFKGTRYEIMAFSILIACVATAMLAFAAMTTKNAAALDACQQSLSEIDADSSVIFD